MNLGKKTARAAERTGRRARVEALGKAQEDWTAGMRRKGASSTSSDCSRSSRG